MTPRNLFLIGAIVLSLLFIHLALAEVTQANPPAAPITQLTFDSAVNVRPAWSRDNLFIAYQSNRESDTYHLYVMNADGSNVRTITKGATDDRHPVWTIDDKSILFDSYDGKSREIWMVNVADGHLTQLTRLGGLANFAVPSPDGKRFIFYYYKDDALNLWSANLDGSDATQLTRDLANAKNDQCTFACHQAAWSPDSKVIAYSGGDHHTIWTMQADGKNQKQAFADDEHNHFPWFFADGNIGFITEHVNSNEAYTEARVLDTKNGNSYTVYDRMSLQGPVEWSNDGKRVLFHSPRSGNFQIYMINLIEPSGLDALRGTPFPNSITTTAQSSKQSNSTSSSPIELTPLLLGGGSILIVLAGLAVGFFLWRRIRA